MIKEKINTRLMGCEFELIVVEQNHEAAVLRLLEGIKEIKRIEDLLTEYSDGSQTSILNRHAGDRPMAVDTEVYQLIKRSLHVSALTQGAFDISASALKSLYNFKDRGEKTPSPERLKEVLTRVGFRHIRLLQDNHVFLAQPDMRIGFAAIGKGYAADKVKSLWKAAGVVAGVVNASGDLTAWGSQPDGRPWKVGIADPANPSAFLMWLPVENASMATSGNYEQYVVIDGIRYSHNIDPRNGRPVRGIQSVTVISPSAELSDALATGVTVMGKEAGLDLINQLPGTHAILVDDENRVFTSQKINRHAYS